MTKTFIFPKNKLHEMKKGKETMTNVLTIEQKSFFSSNKTTTG